MQEVATLSIRVKSEGTKKATEQLKNLSAVSKVTGLASTQMGRATAGASSAISKLTVAGTAATAVAFLGKQMVDASLAAANYGREMSNLARMARMPVEDFQALAFATEKYGVSAQQIADISKDTGDKIGDFLATGGGEFKDFFENVAPQIGITADALKGLSGKDALQAVKNSMDELGLSTKQQIFYLESLGNDASKLIPLLSDNGKELDRLNDKYQAMNLGLSSLDIKVLEDMKESTTLTGLGFESLANNLGVMFAPAIQSVADSINWLLKQLNAITGTPKTLEGVNEKITEVTESHRQALNQIEQMRSNYSGRETETAIISSIEARVVEYENEIKGLQKVRNALLEPPPSVTVPDLQNRSGNPAIQPASDTGSSNDDELEREAERAAAELALQQERNATWLDQLNQRIMSEEELINAREQREIERAEREIANQLDKEDAISLIQKNAFAERLKLEQGADKANRAAKLAVFNDMTGLAKTFAGDQSAIYKGMFAASKAFNIAETISASFPAIAKAWNSAPFPANLPAVATTTASTGALSAAAQAVNLTGMAHSGIDSIPNEGTWLLDKGERVLSPRQNQDFTQFIQKENGSPSGRAMTSSVEPVVQQGNVYVNIENAPEGTEVTQQQEGLDRIVDVTLGQVAEQIESGLGNIPRSLENRYGLNRYGAR